MKLVIGGEYEHDVLAWNNISNQFTPLGGPEFSRSVVAGFGEAHITVIEAHTEGETREALAVTAAGRYDRYSDFGGRFTVSG